MLAWFNSKPPLYNQIIHNFNAVPFPDGKTSINDCRFLVLDLELTGLNAKKDYIISIGWVPVVRQQIILAEAKHYLINAPVSVGQSAIYHGVHDKHLAHARDIADVLTELLEQYAGYIFVAHHSKLETDFLQAACQSCFGKTASLLFIDTLKIEWQRMLLQGKTIAQDSLQLPCCLKRHGLPMSLNHHALEDAYSCATLLLSQLKKGGGAELTLRDLLQQSR